MREITIRLFGRPCYTVAEEPIHGMEARKVQELFIYLLLHRTHPCSREALAAMLWGERNETHAKKYLRQALWQLQSALERAYHPQEPVMQVDNEWVRIHPQAPIWLDVEEFKQAYASLRFEQNVVYLQNNSMRFAGRWSCMRGISWKDGIKIGVFLSANDSCKCIL